MPTLSNEPLRKQILTTLDEMEQGLTTDDIAELLIELFATQNTALLKEVATQVIGEDEPEYTIVQDSPEKPKLYDVTAVRKNQLRAEMRSKLAAMGGQ